MNSTGLILAAAGIALLVIGPLGTRVGVWPFVVGFAMLALAIVLALAAIWFAIADVRRGAGWLVAVATIVLALIPLAVPALVVAGARGKPPIHDISTDISDPPQFVAILPLRTGNVSPAAYDGPDAAAAQRRAYPDVWPLTVTSPIAQTFDGVKTLVGERRWQLVAADAASGRVEAIDTSFWFGFKDDVVIRVRTSGSGSVVDMRSKSRVGVGDLGVNADRIRAFLRDLATRVK